MKYTIYIFILLSLSITLTTPTHASDEFWDKYNPANQNMCPNLSPVPFRYVILTEPSIGCNSLTGYLLVIKKVQHDLGLRAIPKVAFIVSPEDNNAFSTGGMIQVPLFMTSEQAMIDPDKYRIRYLTFLHEFAHTILFDLWGKQNAEYGRLNQIGSEYSEVFSAQQLMYTQLLKEHYALREKYLQQYGPYESMPKEKQMELDHLLNKISDKYEADSDKFNALLTVLNEKLEPFLKLNTFSASYHELFADLTVVLLTENWHAISDMMEAMDSQNYTAYYRDFSDARNRLSEWSKNTLATDKASPYKMLAPARFQIYKTLEREYGCKRINKPLLLSLITHTILQQQKRWNQMQPLEWSPEQSNTFFIDEFLAQLTKVKTKICK